MRNTQQFYAQFEAPLAKQVDFLVQDQSLIELKVEFTVHVQIKSREFVHTLVQIGAQVVHKQTVRFVVVFYGRLLIIVRQAWGMQKNKKKIKLICINQKHK